MKIESLPFTPAAPSTATTPSTAKRRWRASVIGLIVIALAGGGWTVMAWNNKGAATPTMPMQAEKGPPKVEVYELAKADVAVIEARALSVNLPLSGSLTPLTQATIKAKVPGVVTATLVQEGVNVVAGQVLARLDSAELQARMAQQQGILDEAQARLALATKNSANNQALLKQNYISQSAYDTTQNSVDLARASVKAASAQLDLARLALADTIIRAPFAGVISKRHVQAGEKVAPDMSVFSVVNLSQLTLDAQVPASDIPRIKVGQEVQFHVDGFAQRTFAGKVARINPTTEAGSRAMLVYIAVANTDGVLRGGMFAKGQITTEKSNVAPMLPLAALRVGKGGHMVYTVEANKVVERAVTLGLRNDDEGFAEVTAGLAVGTNVIVSKLDGIKPGNKVKVVEPATASAGTSVVAATRG